MADAASIRSVAPAVRNTASSQRHSAMVRVTHWLTAVCFFALLVSGVEIVISHPRFYWGETGNVLTPSLFDLPIPSSRASVPTGYGFVLPDQNGWSRDLHFQSAWLLILTGCVYAASGLMTRHFRTHLLPGRAQLTRAALRKEVSNHLRFRRPGEAEAWSYNALQRIAYLFVVFGLVPLMIWTGLAMSPAVTAAFPGIVTVFGGHQSARTIHFFGTAFLVLFLMVHIVMVCRAGFTKRMRAMITGHSDAQQEHV